MQVATQTETDPTLEQQIEKAEALLPKLVIEATDAEAEARRLAKAYAASRERNLKIDADVAADVAGDKRAAVERHQESVLKPLLAKREQVRRAAIKAKLDADSIEVQKMFEAATAKFCEAIESLDAAISVLAGQNEPRLRAQQQGVQDLLPLSLSEIIRVANQHQLAKFRGTPQELPLKHVLLRFVDSSLGDARVVFEVNRSAAFVSTNLW